MENLIMTYGLSEDQYNILIEALPECTVSDVDGAFTDLIAVPAIAVVINMERMSAYEIRSFTDVFQHDLDTSISCIGESAEVPENELAFFHINDVDPDTLQETIASIKERIQLPAELDAAKARMRSVIERVSKNLNSCSDDSLRTQIGHINNTCDAYERISTILENKEELKLRARYPYRVSMDSVIFAMMIAHGLMEESVLEDAESPIVPERTWILSLSKEIREHFYKDVKLNNG